MVQKSPEGNKGFPLETSFTPVLSCFSYYQLATEMISVLRKHLMANSIGLAGNTGAIIFTFSQESCPLYTSCVSPLEVDGTIPAIFTMFIQFKVERSFTLSIFEGIIKFKLGAGLLSNNSKCGCRCTNCIQLHKLTKIVAAYKQTCMAGVDITELKILLQIFFSH